MIDPHPWLLSPVAPWWGAAIVNIIVTALNIWGSRWMSHREHKQSHEAVKEISKSLGGNGRDSAGYLGRHGNLDEEPSHEGQNDDGDQ